MSKLTRRQLSLGLGGFAATASLGGGVLGDGLVHAKTNDKSAADKNTTNKKLGVALLGLGNYSEWQLAPALQFTQHCELRGIVTGSPEKIPKWQKRYNIPDRNVYNYGNLKDIANNDDIDIVYVVTPTGLHMKYSLVAADAGKHVWCEKPMAMTVEQCQKIIYACRQNKVYLSIGYRMQHEPNTQTVISFVESKPYGNIIHVTAEAGYAGWTPPKGDWRLSRALGGGALYDMGVYCINAARYSTRMEPVSVLARHEVERKEVFTEVDETTYFSLEFSNGVEAKCVTSVGKRLGLLHVQCEKGWYKLAPMQTYNGVKGETSTGVKIDRPIKNQQAQQMDNDALAILNKSKVIVPGEEGLKDIRIVQAALASAKTGKNISIV